MGIVDTLRRHLGFGAARESSTERASEGSGRQGVHQSGFVLALDQGTTSSRAIVFAADLEIKGLAQREVLVGHALKNAAIPLITLIGVNFGYMLGGAVLIESVFSYPGIGRLAAQAIFQRDFPLVQAVAFFASLVVILVNLATDLVYGLVNPQVRLR